jgi:hypothetical protein
MAVTATFPTTISPGKIKFILEGNLKKNSKYECTVTFVGEVDGENDFTIEADSAEAFYLIGMTAYGIIDLVK